MEKLNANSVLLAIVIAAIGWIGTKTSGNNDVLTEIKSQLPFVEQAVNDLKSQIGTLVSRAELDSRISELTAKNAALEKRILVIELAKPVQILPANN